MPSNRQDIQILRGLAVVAVVVFHLGLTNTPNGFLGVDLFFLISGYVITLSLSRLTGSLKERFFEFYRKRIKRIFPAALVTIFITIVATLLVANSLYKGSYLIDGVFATAALANIRFLLEQRSYLASATPTSPFIHYWSLGVEEQFYFIFPIIFFLTTRFRKYFLPGLTVIALAFAFYQAHTSPLTYFYDPAARAWELLLGACAATWHISHTGKTFTLGKLNHIINLIALLTLVYFLFTPQALSPYSVFGALPVIVAGLVIVLLPTSYPYFKPIAYIGEISFTLYLVHWPIINLIDNKIKMHTWKTSMLIIVIMLFSTLIIHYLVENPARFKFSAKKVIISSLAGSLAVISATLVIANSSWAVPKAAITIDLSTPSVYQDGCHIDGVITWPNSDCIYGDAKGSQHWLIIGDSHAAQWFPAFSLLATRNHISLTSITRSSCPALYLATIRYQQEDTSCEFFQHRLSLFISQKHFDKVFISNFTHYPYELVDNSSTLQSQWVSGTKAFIADSKLSAQQLIFIQDTPLAPTNSVACLTEQPKNLSTCDFSLGSDQTFNSLKTFTDHSKYTTLMTDHWLCKASKCFASFNGHNTYRDATHISVPTALELEPKLAQYFHFHS